VPERTQFAGQANAQFLVVFDEKNTLISRRILIHLYDSYPAESGAATFLALYTKITRPAFSISKRSKAQKRRGQIRQRLRRPLASGTSA